MVIRTARATDAEAIAVLVGELGYPTMATEIPDRLASMAGSGRTVALVAEVNGAVVGLVTAQVLRPIHSPNPVALLTALVVMQRARGSGAGRRLVESAEAWARGEGAVRIAVTSGAQRADAHAFYLRIGYDQTGVRFGKKL